MLGIAAHITAAAAGGPRYDGSMTSVQRSAASNAVWLCQGCATIVDRSPDRYTTAILRAWKSLAEEEAHLELAGQGITTGGSADFLVRAVSDEGQWQLEIENLGPNEDEFLVEVVSVGAPVNWARRFPLPWRELSLEENRARDGWQSVPTTRWVNLAHARSFESHVGVHFVDGRERGLEYLHIHSVIHERGDEGFKVELGVPVTIHVEVLTRKSRIRRGIALAATLDRSALEVVEV